MLDASGLSEFDRELIGHVVGVLQYLRADLAKPITEARLKRTAADLRSLLCDGSGNHQYLSAWKLLEFQEKPQVSAATLENGAMEEIRLKIKKHPKTVPHVIHAGGAPLASVAVLVGVGLSGAEVKRLHEQRPKDPLIAMTVGKFLSSPCLIINGSEITRSELIGYFANKLGAVHFDSTRTDKRTQMKYQAMDSLRRHHRIRLLGHSELTFDLLAIGQALVNSQDTERFLARSREFGISET
jgi:hypothetical protein